MKNGRSPGPGGVTVELTKYGGPELLNQLTKLGHYITAVYKKGNRCEVLIAPWVEFLENYWK